MSLATVEDVTTQWLSRWEIKTPEPWEATPGSLAVHVTRDWSPESQQRQAPHLELIDQAFVRISNGDLKRLIITLPPRHGKSERASRWGALWYLRRHPERRIVIASYGAALAEEHSQWVRDTIESHCGQEDTDDLGLRVHPAKRAIERWQLTTNGRARPGGMVAVGVGGPLTGRGCFVAGTPVLTENGWKPIEVVAANPAKWRVASVNHATGNVEWARVQASRRLYSDDIVEVRTIGGRRIRCTADHPFSVSQLQPEYRAAGDLRPGGQVTEVTLEQDVRPMRASKDRSGTGVPALLHDHANRVQRRHLPAMSDGVPEASVRSTQGASSREHGVVLLDSLPRHPHGDPVAAQVRHMRNSDSGQDAEVLRGLPATPRSADPAGSGLSSVRLVLSPEEQPDDVLRAALREPGALDQDERPGQQPLQGRYELQQAVRPDALVDLRAGRRVHRLQDDGRSDRTSRQCRPEGQSAGEPCGAVQVASRRSPQVGADTVALVQRVRGPVQPVYDLQVDGNHNFVADGLLVHNCDLLVIDDPVKTREDADSPTFRRKTWEWWTSTARTRLQPGGAVVLILTRWHEDDLAGRLLAENDDEQWEVLNLPALAEDDDLLGRAPGEPLWPSQYDREALEAIRKDVGARDWLALYQQRPTAPEGAIWRWKWLTDGEVKIGDVPPMHRTVVSVDPAGTNKKTSDATGIVVAGQGIDGHGYVLADRTMKGTPTEWGETVWLTALEFEASHIILEDNQGHDMAENVLRSTWQAVALLFERAGLLPPRIERVNARASKYARAVSVSALYESTAMSKPRIHHVRGGEDLSLLEDELTGWVGTGDSPNRLDANVHAIRWLFLGGDTKQQKQGTVRTGQRWARAGGHR